MLAWQIWVDDDGTERVENLWDQAEFYCEPVIERLTGEKGITLARICEETLATQALEITPSKLAQRADKTERYQEFNDWAELVEDAYSALMSPTPPPENTSVATG
jgi:hypothetical protein